MIKKMKLFLVFSVIFFSFIMYGCSSHNHNFTYFYDENVHYQKCDCGKIINEEEHTFIWIIDKDSTTTEEGYKHQECSACKYERNLNTVIDKKIENMSTVTDEKLIKFLLDYNFLYDFNVPDSTLSYKVMWDGYDLENKFGPTISIESRLFTYLTEYFEKEDSYYLVYFNSNIITEYKNFINEWENTQVNHLDGYHFTTYDDEKVIDGKYLFAYQRMKNSIDYKVYNVNDIKNIRFKIDDYQVCFVAQSKKALLKENISTGKTINKDIVVLNRLVISFDENYKNPSLYEFTNYEKYSEDYINELFSYTGEMLETFTINYEQMEYISYPYQGNNGNFNIEPVRVKVTVYNNEKCVVLPRYIYIKGNKVDLLDENSEPDLFLDEDVFRNHKKSFENALYKDSIDNNSFYIYSLFRYEDVIKIIRIKEGEDI